MTLLRKSDEGRDTSESDDDDQLSIADAASMACASGEDSRAMAKDDQHAGSSSAADEKRWSSLNHILVYKKINDSLSWTVEELRNIAVQTQGNLDDRTRSCTTQRRMRFKSCG